MSSLAITAVIFLCVTVGTFVGMVLRHRLPHEHLDSDTRETVKLATGIVGTMTAILLGLLVASAKNSFDVQRNGVAQIAANLIVLDRTLALYGDETREIRDLVRTSLIDMIARTWPHDAPNLKDASASASTEGRYEVVFEKMLELTPKTEAQRALHSQALKVTGDTGQLRWLLFSQRERSVPLPLLAVMVFWLAISFASFGLFAPRNATAVAALVACALAVASALFLILELDRPFQGVIQISSAPLQKALEQLGR